MPPRHLLMTGVSETVLLINGYWYSRVTNVHTSFKTDRLTVRDLWEYSSQLVTVAFVTFFETARLGISATFYIWKIFPLCDWVSCVVSVSGRCGFPDDYLSKHTSHFHEIPALAGEGGLKVWMIVLLMLICLTYFFSNPLVPISLLSERSGEILLLNSCNK